MAAAKTALDSSPVVGTFLQVLTPHDYILPEGWIVAHSRREKRDYFFNNRDNTTQWHPPEGSRPREPS